MVAPTDPAGKPLPEIRNDFERFAREFGPCDVVLSVIELCEELSRR
jgi:hypothetical protein